MPARRISDRHQGRREGSTTQPGSTLFERMRRLAEAPCARSGEMDISRFLNNSHSEARDLVVVDVAPQSGHASVRFDRAEVDSQPGVVMQQQDEAGAWREIWSLPTQSADAREGMLGWLNTQSHRWDRFARILRRRGADELTAWIFELMVMPETGHARPPRFEPEQRQTINYYARRIDDCTCRPASIQQSRSRAGGYC